MSGDTAAQLWCGEQLQGQYSQWRLQQQLLAPVLRDEVIWLHGIFSALLQLPLAATAAEVAEPKLAWWTDALQQLMACGEAAVSDPTITASAQPSLAHPALRHLPDSPLLSFLRAVPLTDWLQDVQHAIHPQVVADTATLTHCCCCLAAPMAWLDHWLLKPGDRQQAQAAADQCDSDLRTVRNVHARRLLLQQINLLPEYNWLYHNMPLSLRARHQLQLDLVPSARQTALAPESGQQQAWRCPGTLLADLLAIDAELDTAIQLGMGSMAPSLQAQCRFWQAGNEALANSLRKRVNSEHARPVSGIGPGLLWSCWRSARAVLAQTR